MTVAEVVRERFWTVTLRIMDSGAVWPDGLWTEDGTWFQNPFHWPGQLRQLRREAMAMFCSCAW